MTAKRSQVFLGDLLEALHSLRPDEEELRIIAALLGLPKYFGRGGARAAARPGDAPSLSEDGVTRSTAEAEKPPSKSRKRVKGDPLASRLESAPSEAVEITLDEVPMAAPSLEGAVPEQLPDALLMPTWTRAILSSSLATPSEEGPIDVDRIVDTLARGQLPPRIPRLLRPTLRKGVQVLLDKGQAMVPFTTDVNRLAEEVQHVVGVEHVECLVFAGCPTRGIISDALGRESPYATPPPGTPVLVLTDLGIGRAPFSTGRGSLREWLAFAAAVARARCPLLAFVPYAPARWPHALRRALNIVQWDRVTTAGTVRNLMKKGARFT